MQIRPAFALLTILFASSSAMAKTPLEWLTGLYSNVRVSDETGDIGGMEARFFEEAGKHMVEFIWCESVCSDNYKIELTRGDNAFMFPYFQVHKDDEDRGQTDLHYVIVPSGKNKIKITVYEGREPLNDNVPQVLKRVKKPIALPSPMSSDAPGH